MTKNKARLIKSLFTCLSVFIIVSVTSVQGQDANIIEATSLRCEGRIEPVGIDAANPNFSWQLQSEQRGTMQSAYHIHTASEKELLIKGDLTASPTTTTEMDE